MIPAVTDLVAQAPPESKNSDAQRKIPLPSDKFAEHLKAKKAPRDGQEQNSPPRRREAEHPSKASESEGRPTKVRLKATSENNQNIRGEVTGAETREVEADDDLKNESVPNTLITVGLNTTVVQPIEQVDDEPSLELDPAMVMAALSEPVEELQPVGNLKPIDELPALKELGSETPTALGAVEIGVHESPDAVSGTLDPARYPMTVAAPLANEAIPAQVTPPAQLPENASKEEQLTEATAKVDATTNPSNLNISPTGVEQSSELAAADGESTPAKETKSEKSKDGPKFASYLFADANSQPTTALLESPKLSPLNGRENGAEEEHARDDEKTASENTQELAKAKVEPSPLLTPVDAAQAAASTLPHSLRRHLELQGTTSHTASSSTSPVISDAQQARLLQRVTRAFRMADERGGEVQIRLSPPELGSMKLEMSLSDGVLTAKLEVETQKAQQILLDSLPNLKERLAEQGIRIEKFDVNLPQRDSSGQQSQQQDSPSDRQSRANAASSRQTRESATPDTVTVQRPKADASRLNVIV